MKEDDPIPGKQDCLPDPESDEAIRHPSAPMTGGFASLMPKDEDVAHAIEVLHEMEGTFRDRNLELRHEPELGWPEGYRPRRSRKH